jgi:hypothetical protein
MKEAEPVRVLYSRGVISSDKSLVLNEPHALTCLIKFRVLSTEYICVSCGSLSKQLLFP